MFREKDPYSIDLLQNLKEHEKDLEKKKIFDRRYSDILLVFDLDPQDPRFSQEKIREMASYFVESSDMGKLYLNYPMVEAFYHMKSIPDPQYLSYTASLAELRAKEYKKRVEVENRNHNFRKFAVNRNECNTVIRQNLEKAQLLTRKADQSPETQIILEVELSELDRKKRIPVLCTCVFYIIDYNPRLILE